ncbi:His-Xaa-Ser system radical SAM maturase HxsC [Corallococcus carmarthensis]|uniref:His-Xaa-Ser system radical SAM maturase HxsC n=1 Tax=Corallococcus carmarthensis TaxID=2316728 RepID=UPI00148D6161|nr:His-Xaa-Ser system radical SAM maturase HxsC [Corallococcus carmarthensis]NOK17568.1 His-Xaa-Ser system radical SAM maturase HxsC [Corallococcus carmarthensis]
MTPALSALGLRPLSRASTHPFLGRIREGALSTPDGGVPEILLVREPQGGLPPGFRAYLLGTPASDVNVPDAYVLPPGFLPLAEGDVVRVEPSSGRLNALYRRASPSNSLLVTERCDNYCLMCSQPPRTHDDSWLLEELMELIPLISPETHELGITGGEPGLLGEGLLRLVEQLKTHLPATAVHMLSNGRSFAEEGFAQRLGRLRHPDLMVGIPLYSDLPEEHDHVVQARGAYDETLRGILNLKRAGVRVELRVVIHAFTHERLPELARFIARNLLFVDHVALMGLELMGFAKTNLPKLWVDPLDYQEPLRAAVRILDRAGVNTSLYNHPLCVLPTDLHPFARKSISDWKNVYFRECEGCALREACGGFFASSALKRSRGIAPVRP